MQELQQIKKGRTDTITVITPEIIERIPKVKLFNNNEMDLKLYNFHKELLDVSMKKNNSNEVGFFWNLNNLDEVFVIKGSQKSITLSDTIVCNWIKTAPKYSIVVMHNHPRNGLFSGADLKSFVDYVSIYAMTAVCNDGTIYTIYKTSEFDPIALMVYYNNGIQKGGEYSGIKHVAKNASKIGIKYKCSIKRRK